jgi:cyclopropane fatty-acyl-phospholipid synthase-like methyltransferase
MNSSSEANDFQNPTSPEKIRLVGLYLRLGPQPRVLDVACGKDGSAVILAREVGCRIGGVDIRTVLGFGGRFRG